MQSEALNLQARALLTNTPTKFFGLQFWHWLTPFLKNFEAGRSLFADLRTWPKKCASLVSAMTVLALLCLPDLMLDCRRQRGWKFTLQLLSDCGITKGGCFSDGRSPILAMWTAFSFEVLANKMRKLYFHSALVKSGTIDASSKGFWE